MQIESKSDLAPIIIFGLCEEKKGHYGITGFFDLYCTPGPLITEKFQELAEEAKENCPISGALNCDIIKLWS